MKRIYGTAFMLLGVWECKAMAPSPASPSTPSRLPPPKSAAALRRLLLEAMHSKQCLPMPCVYDGLTARLVERAGFPLTFMTGFGVSAVHGLPDTQLISFAEMQQSAQLITSSLTSIPCFGDGDTGYGSFANVERTIRGYVAAGLAGIMIEDQRSPKKCGHTKGKDVVSREEAVARVRAAVRARARLIQELNPGLLEASSGDAGPAVSWDAAAHVPGDLVIIARTDARGVYGMDEALARLQAFRAIEGFRDSDMTFLEAPTSEAELARYGREVAGPKLANCLECGLTPVLHRERLGDLGFTVAAYPLSLLAGCVRAMDEILATLARGRPLPIDDGDGSVSERGNGDRETPAVPIGALASFERTCEAVGFPEYYEREAALAKDNDGGGGAEPPASDAQQKAKEINASFREWRGNR